MAEKIVEKLTSRKLWIAVAAFVAMIMIYCGCDENSATAVASIIMAGATVIAYIVGEGLVDASNETEEEIIIDMDEVDDDDEDETEEDEEEMG